ncbi:MAG: head GIN domain-containing protein [Candidatus Dojkabacteria bacterium]
MFKMNLRVILFTLFVIALIICSTILAVFYFIIYPASIVQGNGNITSEKRNLPKFTKISASDKVTLNISQGSSDENLEIKAEDNIIKQITTEVRGDTLYINFARQTILGFNTINPNKEVLINLNYKDLQAIDLSGDVSLKSENKVRVDKLDLNQSGNSMTSMEIFTNSLNVNISGNSVVNLTGSATKQEVNASGGAKYTANDLDSKDCKVVLSGLGTIKIRADESLDLNVSGAGTVEYQGSPKKLTQNISGAGAVKQVSN